jgi:hypothetical protein
VLTGWGRTLTTWTPRITRHAVHPELADRCQAVCGAPLVVIQLTRPWSGEDTADTDACRRCTELLERARGRSTRRASADRPEPWRDIAARLLSPGSWAAEPVDHRGTTTVWGR